VRMAGLGDRGQDGSVRTHGFASGHRRLS